ncbi:golgin candidate 2 isoform X2 [Elaeis guineensis]|uniref:Golgin candidate 2 isoform X2 n=1 Tax=Elaeis guineensis var. tenera TaxID=51953 RepID=A0A8N4EUP5_ELAGV|nr:golgin candidate 2 isoform X2 [Elaeis guineensis]
MAGWISSKLKVAETFLQQIDQQAAESLGKNVGPRSPSKAPGSSDEIPKRTDSALPLKYQLPKKSPPPPDIGHPRGKRLAAAQPPSPATDPDPAIADGDWTELLGSPKPASAAARPDGGTTKKPMARKGSRSAQKLGTRPNFAVPEGELVIKGPSREEEREREPPSSEVPSSRGSSDSRQGTPSPEESIKGGPGSRLSQLEIHRGDVRTLGLREMDSPSRDDKEVVGGDGRKSSGIAEGAHPNVPVPRNSDTPDNSRSFLGSSDESESGSNSSSTSDSENESKRRAERRRRRQQMLAEKMKAIAAEAIKERENIVARLEGEKQSLEKILVEREKKQAEEASELQMSMIETLEAVEKEKEKHNSTRMEALARLAKLEATNADLARSLATNQWNLEMEVNRVAELWQQIELKELTQEDSLRRSQLEQEMLGAEFSFICDKIVKLKAMAKKLEDNIEITRREMLHPTEVEVELKKRLDQLTDRLIQKQTQVESLSSEKATLMLRMEMVSKLLDESGLSLQANDFADYLETGLANLSARVDIEAGTWQLSSSVLNPALHDRMRTGQQQLGSVLRQLDAIFSAGVVCLRRNPKAQIWSLLYLLCLHLWVMYILTSHSPVSDSARPGAVFSLEAINKTSGS